MIRYCLQNKFLYLTFLSLFYNKYHGILASKVEARSSVTICITWSLIDLHHSNLISNHVLISLKYLLERPRLFGAGDYMAGTSGGSTSTRESSSSSTSPHTSSPSSFNNTGATTKFLRGRSRLRHDQNVAELQHSPDDGGNFYRNQEIDMASLVTAGNVGWFGSYQAAQCLINPTSRY